MEERGATVDERTEFIRIISRLPQQAKQGMFDFLRG